MISMSSRVPSEWVKEGMGEVSSLLRRRVMKRWIQPCSSSPGQETWTCLVRAGGEEKGQKSAPADSSHAAHEPQASVGF